MGIIGNMLGRREPGNAYRTIDGGHPAPFPDMTDQQLYNYEMAFNVSRKTFDQPPPVASGASPEPVEPAAESGRRARKSGDRVLDSARFSARQAKPQAEAHRSRSETVRPQAEPAAEQGAAPLDFSRPVRVITTRQPVEILTTRARHPVYKVHGYIGDADVATVFTLDGRLSEHGPRFLENVPAARELFLNLYPGAPGAPEPYRITQHATREDADAAAEGGRLHCIAVQLD